MCKSQEIRDSFLKFFESKGHLVWPSSSLIPVNDPTLLLIGAGMAPFKSYFKGEADPPCRRMATCQKCVRADDIDRVGKTIRHHTFFEMLGNFSFGDYYKKESILWAWEYFIKVLKLPEEKLWVTVHIDDDEAYKIWNKEVGLEPSRIIRLKEMFWGPIGLTGPCGPCTELCYDLGEKFGCGKPDCQPGCDCDRYLELWNLVFTGLNKNEKGQFENLPAPCIDTGLGFERLMMVLQNKPSPYETDLFQEIMDKIIKLEDKEYIKLLGEKEIATAERIIADHIRSAVFMIGDNITPSNEGRGYVLRRLLRRAVYFGRRVGISGRGRDDIKKYVSFLPDLVDPVVNIMGEIYPEVSQKIKYIKEIISGEENSFNETLMKGIVYYETEKNKLAISGEKILSGEAVFKLYDTYGYPLEMTKEITERDGIQIDEEGFKSLLEEQREKSRKDQQGKLAVMGDSIVTGLKTEDSEFVGRDRDTFEVKTKILAIFKDGKEAESAENEEIQIVLEKTPFYAESGGQVGDQGTILSPESLENSGAGSPSFMVIIKENNTFKNQEGVHIHKGTLTGRLSKGDEVIARVDKNSRESIMSHHTATHLLQAALRKVLGAHVTQAGSSVSPERLRFDFSHYKALTEEEKKKIEKLVNDWADVKKPIKPVEKKEMSLKEAIDSGALAFFEDKYGEKVRVITIKDENGEIISSELCGGTHEESAQAIGIFGISNESSIGAGLRRIEARCKNFHSKEFKEEKERLQSARHYFLSPRLKDAGYFNKIERLLKEKKHSEEQLAGMGERIEFKKEDIGPKPPVPDDLSENVKNTLIQLYGAAEEIGCPYSQLDKFEDYYKKFEEYVKNLDKKIKEKKKAGALGEIDNLVNLKKEIDGVNVISGSIKDATREALMEIVDRIKVKIKSGIVVLGTVLDDKPVLICGITKDLVQKGFHAGKIISQIAEAVGGKGGGRPDFAQAGGKNKEGLKSALEKVYDIVK